MPPPISNTIVNIVTKNSGDPWITIEKEKVEGLCQHNITWDRISELKTSNVKLFLDELYQYIQTYVQENGNLIEGEPVKWGATDENGNPICTDIKSTWEFIKKWQKIKSN